MASCADCTELFCTEVKGADEIECAVRCSCNKGLMFADDFVGISETPEGFQKQIEKALEYTRKWTVTANATAQLKRVQKGIQDGTAADVAVAAATAPAYATSLDESNKIKKAEKKAAAAAAAETSTPKATPTPQQQARTDAKTKAKAQAQAEAKAQEAKAQAQAHARAQQVEAKAKATLQAAKAQEQQERERQEKARAEARAEAKAIAAAKEKEEAERRVATFDLAGTAEKGLERERGTNMMPKKVKKKKGKKKGKGGGGGGGGWEAGANLAGDGGGGGAVAGRIALSTGDFIEEGAEVPPGLLYNDPPEGGGDGDGGADGRVVDHSVIKAWVLEVAAKKRKTTPGEIARYFHGRVDADVVDSYMEVFNNNCRDTVIQCAEFLNIVVPPEEQEEGEARALGEEGVHDELVAGAFAARERVKQGDYDFVEHPLERRANEAKQNDCKDLKVLQAILDEAKGQPGLAGMRKMLNKMVKRIKAVQEEQKLLRKEQAQGAKREISQKLPAAYANKEPAFTSFQPPNIAYDKEPDAVINIPPNIVGWVIGKAGVRINELQARTGATMWVDQNMPAGEMRKLIIHGSKLHVDAAVKEVKWLLQSAPGNHPPPAAPRAGKMSPHETTAGYGESPPSEADGHTSKTLECPHALVGYLIGKKGVMIKRIKSHSNANVEVYQNLPDGVPRQVHISGSVECVTLATCMVEEVIASGIAADNPGTEQSDMPPLSSTPSTGSGPVLGFSTSISQELLSSVGYLNLLPNFLEQEFDVNAIALMQDKDFEEIRVPKGPQLKIQRACRAAGLGSAPTAAATAGTGGGGGRGVLRAVSSESDRDSKKTCAICFEKPIQASLSFLLDKG
eukprot:jgi/Undpi1/9859/HiC_scaffold_28.g12313.m1